jgi:hydrogenase maturation protease
MRKGILSILIAGLGNIFRGDDAFGVEVAQRLSLRKLPDGVHVRDFGIRGFDLCYALLDGPDITILIDATPRGGQPGTLYTIEPDLNDLRSGSHPEMEAHGMNPMAVLRIARSMGSLKRILLVGCEPGDLGGEEGKLGLSAPVKAAVEEAVVLVEALVSRLLKTSADLGFANV